MNTVWINKPLTDVSHNVELKTKHGAPPDLVTLNANGQEVEVSYVWCSTLM